MILVYLSGTLMTEGTDYEFREGSRLPSFKFPVKWGPKADTLSVLDTNTDTRVDCIATANPENRWMERGAYQEMLKRREALSDELDAIDSLIGKRGRG